MSAVIGNPLLLGPEGYQISRSVRLRSSASAYFSRTPASAGNRKTWTWSGWVKRGALANGTLFDGGSTGPLCSFQFSSDQLRLYVTNTGITTSEIPITTAVFRDPSAWYHVVLALDTTQATATNRVKIYVNGVQQTITGLTGTVIGLNGDLGINRAVATNIGYYSYGSSTYFDGYITEINFIDGQALTPSSFGENDTITGVWKPKKYTGTYGTNGFYLPFSDNASLTRLGFDQRPSTTVYANGWRNSFNGSASLTAATNAAFAVGTNNFTMEAWIKPTSHTGQIIFVASNGIQLGYQNTSTWGLCQANVAWQLTTTTMPTLNAWNHVVVVRSGTGTNQTAIFLNGTRVAQGTISTSYAQNSCVVGSGITGDLTNVRLVNGTAIYDPTQTMLTVPTAPLSNVTNTAILTCQNETFVDNSSNAFSLTNSATTSARDSTFNTCNDWVSNNISLTAGVTYDSMLDTPTPYADGGTGRGNYCVVNPLKKSSSATITDGNLTVAINVVGGEQPASFAVSSGKWYWEVTPNAVYSAPGILLTSRTPSASSIASDYHYYGSNGQFYTNTSGVAYGATFGNGDVIGVALDLDSNQITFYKNGTSQGAKTIVAGEYNPDLAGATTVTNYANFGQRPFTYTPPTGFKALNTQNLPDSTIKKGNQYFDVVTRNGFGSSGGSITSLQFQPDFMWEKQRNGVSNHYLVDAVRGVSKYLNSDATAAEGTLATYVTSFNSNGYTMGSSDFATTATMVDYVWKESVTAGFDIVTFTNPASGSASFAHSLGVKPSMIITKARSGTGNWTVTHKSLGANMQDYYLLLNGTAASTTSAGIWGGEPTSSVFYSSASLQVPSATMVAYLFSEVAGFSKFGSYTGNGSSDGPFVYCGFRPRWVMIKSSTVSGTSWVILDTSRDTYNVETNGLFANLPDADSPGYLLDGLSNGFKIRNAGSGQNSNGGTYIYAAFAENPFKFSLAR